MTDPHDVETLSDDDLRLIAAIDEALRAERESMPAWSFEDPSENPRGWAYAGTGTE